MTFQKKIDVYNQSDKDVQQYICFQQMTPYQVLLLAAVCDLHC